MFTRRRKLPFKSILQLILRKSVKPLQLVLNEWTDTLDYEISASALTQARRNLKHTAFIELLEECVVKVMYSSDDYQKYKGHRLLAVDGTSLRLPTTPELSEKFGLIVHLNGSKQRASNQVEAKATILYDVLNEIPISAELLPGRTNDLKACQGQLEHLNKGDILIADRAYGSYRFFADIIASNGNFIIRCKEKTFERYHGLFQSSNAKEKTVELDAPAKIMKKGNVPAKLQVRFVRVELDSGEVEVLATSLLDKRLYPHREFKKLYHMRWGIETYFHTLKSRLSIDNFSGKTFNAILQDFYATIFVSGLETIITAPINEELSKTNSKYRRRVNKAIAFHTIKNKIIKMVFDPQPDDQEKIERLFLQNPNLIRPDREKPPRIASTSDNKTRNSLYFQRYARKHVF